MADNPIPTPLPADLPTNWVYGQTVAPTGAEAGLATQYGYNYLMAAVNAAQTAINTIAAAFENLADLSGGTIPVDQLPAGVAGGVASLDQAGKVPASQLPAMDYLPLAGGNMQGAINMSNYRITNLNTPANAQDAATKAYVDALQALVENAGYSKMKTGSYVGNGRNTLNVTVGFKPGFVFVFCASQDWSGSTMANFAIYASKAIERSDGSRNTQTVSVTASGFKVVSDYELYAMNSQDTTYVWVAFV